MIDSPGFREPEDRQRLRELELHVEGLSRATSRTALQVVVVVVVEVVSFPRCDLDVPRCEHKRTL